MDLQCCIIKEEMGLESITTNSKSNTDKMPQKTQNLQGLDAVAKVI